MSTPKAEMTNIEMMRKIRNEKLIEKSIRINSGEREDTVYFNKVKRK